jgi:hypothetical protein
MNAIIEFCLCMLDALLDVITFGRWSKWQGDVVPNVSVKKDVQ